MRFIHAADLHVDASMSGLRRREGEADHDFHLATRRAVTNLVDFAVAERVDFLLVAGDVFDGDWADYATGLFFSRALADLGRAGIPVVMIRGNHDASSKATRRLTWPGHVRVLGSREPETHSFEGLAVSVHGQSFPDAAVPGNLAANYPKAVPGHFNIGLLHTSLAGGSRHDTYAPCSLDDLRAAGYDYWALGHVHEAAVLCEAPHVVYPGNIQGRHVNEPGARGFVLVDVEDGRVSRVTKVPADALRWCRVRVDLSGATSFPDVSVAVATALDEAAARADGRPVAARLELRGATATHGALVSDRERLEAECDAAAARVGEVWLERIVVATTPSSGSATADAEAAGLAETLRAVASDPGEREAIRRALEADLGRLPAPLRLAAGVALDDDAIEGLLADATALLSHRLAEPARGR